MTPAVVEPVTLIYKLNNRLVGRSLEGLTDDEMWQAGPGGGNPIAWLLGHITESRIGLLAALGRPTETGWGRVFSRGSVRGAPTSYPSRAAIEASWHATHGRMREAFDAVTDGQLAAPPTIELPGAKTLADQAAFFAFHESYHVGQIGYVRKFLGHSAIAG